MLKNSGKIRWEQNEKLEIWQSVIKYKKEPNRDTITEINYTLGGGIHGRLDDTEVRITKLEDRVVEIYGCWTEKE